VGGFFGLQSGGEISAAQKPGAFQSDVIAHRDNAIQNAQVANACFIGAGAAAAAALVTYLFVH
jgi:hypothetical protein